MMMLVSGVVGLWKMFPLMLLWLGAVVVAGVSFRKAPVSAGLVVGAALLFLLRLPIYAAWGVVGWMVWNLGFPPEVVDLAMSLLTRGMEAIGLLLLVAAAVIGRPPAAEVME